MKQFKLFIFTLSLFLNGIHANAQQHVLLQDFSGYQLDDHLVLRWTFRLGSLCEDTRIERSEDGLVFAEIGHIPGICGNPESSITYTFTDSCPRPNAVNYYRLELGNYGYTSALPLEFLNSGNSGFVVLSAGDGQTDVLFQNIPGRTGKAILYTGDGRRLSEFEIKGKRLRLPSGRFSAGIYLLMLAFSDNTSVSGNFVIP